MISKTDVFYGEDVIMWELVKVLIFRFSKRIRSTLSNIMVNEATNEVLSIGEMAGERILIDYLFTKLPKKKVCESTSSVPYRRSSRLQHVIRVQVYKNVHL